MTADELKHKALSYTLPLVPALLLLNACTSTESGSYQDPKPHGKAV